MGNFLRRTNGQIDFDELAERLRSDVPKAQRCWEIWMNTTLFNYPTDKLTAEQNRRNAFQYESGLPDKAVLTLTTELSKFEKEIK